MQRLKKIDIQGFKTFAARTELLFDEKVTAIVGPNGSGKSNIADAIRWVLGEQSFRALRSRRTEDLIFSGSEKRPRVGMATVTIHLDNSSHWLPVDFQEVTISRRAYRSGENVYKMNGKRVRLADINDLLGKTGLSRRTYMVIGQGLVDRVLSLRAEERRSLFEEAAGIAPYQQKRTLTLNRLAETKANLLRVHDIVTEMEPRLRYLERQAARAREIENLRDELRGHLRLWYGHRWGQAQAAKQAADAEVSRQQTKLLEAEKSFNALSREIPTIESERRKLFSDIRAWQEEMESLSHRKSETERVIAVAQERLKLLQGQREEAVQEIARMEQESAQAAERLRSLQKQVKSLEEERSGLAAEVRAAEEELADRRKTRSALEKRLEGARQASAKYRAEVRQMKSRLQELRDESERLDREKSDLRKKFETAQAEAKGQEAALAEAKAALERERQSLEEAQARIRHLRSEMDRLRALVDERRAAVLDAKQKVRALEERKRILERLQEEGAGLYGGVRRVMQARSRLQGIVGIVGELLEVPAELETAIDVALGSRQQDVVVRRWADAERAIELLKREHAGRATFLPLDTLRPRKPLRRPDVDGVVGVASELVRAPDDLRNVVTHLLGRTVVVRRLDVAREVLRRVQGGYQVVTVEGEVVQSSGSVTGGSRRQRGPDILSRSRELKMLPKEVAEAGKGLAESERALERAAADLHEAEKALAEAEQDARSGERRVREAQEAWLAADRSAQEAAQKVRWLQSKLDDLAGARERIAEARRRILHEMEEAARKQQEAESLASDLLAKLESGDGGTEAELAARVADLRAKLAGMDGLLRQHRSELESLRRQSAQMGFRLQGRRSRLEHLQREIAAAEQTVADGESSLREIASGISGLEERLKPAGERVSELDRRLSELRSRRDSLRAELRAQEERYRQALLERERRLDAIERLRGELEEAQLSYSFLPPEANGNPAAALPVVVEVDEGLEERISAAKLRLRRMGGVSPEVLSEYESVKSRYEFLQQQATDLEEAIASLKEVIAELDRKMEEAFLETYEKIAREFKAYFTRLFGGGHAYLSLTSPSDLSETGVDIFARPPGKRAQGLALLSGGERALTAASLLFAILKVSPPPFVVLDEVDAALDEANVGRFREALEELSDLTQFVVITHNRGTIEAAKTVYGVSLRPDGTSQVLSLKLEHA